MLTGISVDFITGLLGFFFTLMVFSYLWGDNPLFRLAVYAFVGVSAGYAATVAWYQVIIPKLVAPLATGNMNERLGLIAPLILSLMLFSKAIPMLARLGNVPTAFLVGVGAAVAIGGALVGTLIPQMWATINGFDLVAAVANQVNLLGLLVKSGLVLVGTLTTLAYFHFGVSAKTGKRNALIGLLALVGQFFIGVTFGVLFAGAYAAVVTALVERMHFIVTFLLSLFSV
jgi:hypothetical protein